MSDPQPFNEITLTRQSLLRLCEDKSVLYSVAQILDLIAHSSVGLGEVLQDYAGQACIQLREVISAAQNASAGRITADDLEVLRTIHMIMKSVKTVLDMTPPAMGRNKAEAIGDKEKFTRSELVKITQDFSHCPDIIRLLAAEDCGQKFVDMLMQSGVQPVAAPGRAEGDAQDGLRH